MNEQSNSSQTPLLVLRVEGSLTDEQHRMLHQSLEPLAKKLGAVAALEEPGVTIRMEPNPQSLLSAISQLVQTQAKQTQAISQLTEAIQMMLLEEGLDEEAIPTTLDGR